MHAQEAVLCADIGTSSLKISLIGFDGKQLSFIREPYPFEKVTSGTVEASDWESAFRNGTAFILNKHRDVKIRAVAVSGNGPTLVPVTKDDTALFPLHWHDRRVFIPEGAGKPASFFLPHAAWLKHNDQAAYENVKWFFSSQEWLSFRLGADPVTVLPSPAYEPFYWDREQLDLFGIDGKTLPPFTDLGTRIGTVSARAAASFGLEQGVPIVAGGPDYIMALIGTGAIHDGMVCDRAGTSEGINVCTGTPVFAEGLRTLPHVTGGHWNVGAMIPTSGRLFEWFREITGQRDRSYQEMLEEIISGQGFDCLASESDFFPNLNASGMLTSPSCFVSTAGLTTRAQLGRAMVESIGFMVLDALDTLKANGFAVQEMRLSGGQAKNPLWNQLKANICGCSLLVPDIIDAELAGDACAAMLYLKEARDLEEACLGIVKINRIYTSDPKCHRNYIDQFKEYKKMKAGMEKLFT